MAWQGYDQSRRRDSRRLSTFCRRHLFTSHSSNSSGATIRHHILVNIPGYLFAPCHDLQSVQGFIQTPLVGYPRRTLGVTNHHAAISTASCITLCQIGRDLSPLEGPSHHPRAHAPLTFFFVFFFFFFFFDLFTVLLSLRL